MLVIICLIIWLNIRLINYKNLTTEIVGQNILHYDN